MSSASTTSAKSFSRSLPTTNLSPGGGSNFPGYGENVTCMTLARTVPSRSAYPAVSGSSVKTNIFKVWPCNDARCLTMMPACLSEIVRQAAYLSVLRARARACSEASSAALDLPIATPATVLASSANALARDAASAAPSADFFASPASMVRFAISPSAIVWRCLEKKGRFLYIWLIEYGGFFHGDEGIPVKRGSSKIRKYQGRAEWLSGDVIGNSAGNFFNFTSRAMG